MFFRGREKPKESLSNFLNRFKHHVIPFFRRSMVKEDMALSIGLFDAGLSYEWQNLKREQVSSLLRR